MRLRRTFLSMLVLGNGLALAGCETFDLDNMFSNKKPLPGERRAVFPEGVPGVQHGVPPNLVRGYQPPSEAQPEPVAEPEKPKPAPRRVATPARPASTPRQQQQQQQAVEQPPQPATQQPSQAAWPAPRPASQPAPAWPAPPSGPAPQSSQPTTVWPDPPRPGNSTR
jgi:hypothetical protein